MGAARMGSIWRPKVRDFGHVIVFSAVCSVTQSGANHKQVRAPSRKGCPEGVHLAAQKPRLWPRHSIFWPDHPNPHPGPCAVLPKVGLTTYKFGSPAHKAVFDKLKVLWESSLFQKSPL